MNTLESKLFFLQIQKRLEAGGLIEWGAVRATGGRELVCRLMAVGSTQVNLWVYPAMGKVEGPTRICFPPAWAARGIDLNRMYFARTDKPLEDLRAVFFGDEFSRVVLDSFALSEPQYRFLAQQARALKKEVHVMRPTRLSRTAANPFAAIRFNVSLDAKDLSETRFFIEPIRGPWGQNFFVGESDT